MRIHRSIDAPPRKSASWDEQWAAEDQGLIASWERGREKAVEDPALTERIRDGALPVLPWKGGLDPTRKLKLKKKYGSLLYLAMWQGMRGEDLSIDLDGEQSRTCSATHVEVVFTGDITKLDDE